jgi:hypothetical protein
MNERRHEIERRASVYGSDHAFCADVLGELLNDGMTPPVGRTRPGNFNRAREVIRHLRQGDYHRVGSLLSGHVAACAYAQAKEDVSDEECELIRN